MNFFSTHKKLFLIIGFLALVLLIAYLLWLIFFRSPLVVSPSVSPSETTGGLPTAEEGGPTTTITGETGNLPGEPGVTPAPGPNEPNILAVGGLTKTESITNAPILDPTLSPSGGVQYYNKNDEKFYSLDKNGNPRLLSDKVFHDVSGVVWAPSKDKAIIEYPDGNKILYNFTTKTQVTLPAHWQDFSFSPASGQIVSKSLGIDPENNWLVVSSDDGSKAKTLENIGTNDQTVYPDWSPNGQIVATYTKGLDFNRQEVFFVGLNGENFKSTIVEGRGFESQWSTTGDRLLYSVYSTDSNLNPQLWIVDAAGDTISQNRKNLSLQTWSSKCTFASNTEIYCAVPESLEKAAGMFPELADRTKDNLYKINLTTGAQELIAVPNGAYNISQIMVPASDDYLYFTDKKTNQIYKVRLR